MEQLDELLNAVVRYVQDQPDAGSGAAVATEASTKIQQLVMQVAQLRSAYYRQATAEGWTMEDLAEVCGITRSRVEQIINR